MELLDLKIEIAVLFFSVSTNKKRLAALSVLVHMLLDVSTGWSTSL